MTRLLWFLIGCGAGFLLDTGLTRVLITYADVNLFLARVPALAAALIVFGLLIRGHLARNGPPHDAHAGTRWWTVLLTSALVNYAIYSALLYRAPFLQPVIAVAAAYLAAILYGALGFSRFAFRHRNR